MSGNILTIGDISTTNSLSILTRPYSYIPNTRVGMVTIPNSYVGIGTMIPRASLDLRGTIRLVTGNQGNNKVLSSDADGNADWVSLSSIIDTSVTLNDVSNNSINTADSVYQMTSGTPVEFKNSSGSSVLKISDGNLVTIGGYSDDLGLRINASNIGGGSTSQFEIWDQTPIRRFSIRLNESANYIDGYEGALFIQRFSTNDIYLGDYGSNKAFRIQRSTGRITIGSGSAVGNPTATLDINGNLSIGANYVSTSTFTQNSLRVEGDTGLGVLNPEAKLHVEGTLRFNTTNQSDGYFLKTTGINGDADWAQITTSDISDYSTPTLQQVTDAGNTTTNSISIEASQYKYSNNLIGEIRGNTNTYNNFDLVYGAYWNGSNWIDSLGAYESYKLSLGTNGIKFFSGSNQAGGNPVTYTERLRMAASGNVLIGTTTDSGENLQVAGNQVINTNGNTSSTTGFKILNSDGNTMLHVLDNGNVGINIDANTSTSYRLRVDGGIWANSFEQLETLRGRSGVGRIEYYNTGGSHRTLGFRTYGSHPAETVKGFVELSSQVLTYSGMGNIVLHADPDFADHPTLVIRSLNTSADSFYMQNYHHDQGALFITKAASGGDDSIRFRPGRTNDKLVINTNGIEIDGNVHITGALYDSNDSPGTLGQILSSTVTGTDWVSLSDIQGVDGSGTVNYLPVWTDSDTIGNSRVLQDVNGIKLFGLTGRAYTRLQILSPDTGSLALFEITHGADANNASAVIYGRGDTSYPTINSISRGTGVSKSINFAIDQSEKMRIATTGNILIGTTTDAGYKLDVNGTARVVDDFTVGTNALYVNTVNNRVGIGRTSPTSKLHIFSDTHSDFLDNGILVDVSSSDEGEPAIAFRNQSDMGSNYWIVGVNQGGQNLDFAYGTAFTTATTKMRITPTGNVGIGTTTPSSKLHVNGTSLLGGNTTIAGIVHISASNPGLAFIDTNASNTADRQWIILPDDGTFKLRASDGTSYFDGDNALEIYRNGPTVNTVAFPNGNVGIGTDAPNSRLQVAGDVYINDHLNIGYGSTSAKLVINAPLSTDSRSIYIGEDSRGGGIMMNQNGGGQVELSLYTYNIGNGSTKRLTVRESGNVGIGVTTPSATLDVVGTLQFETGNEGANKVLVSDASGNADWQDLSNILKITNYASLNFADDSAADTGGVPLGGIYHTNGVLKVRIT